MKKKSMKNCCFILLLFLIFIILSCTDSRKKISVSKETAEDLYRIIAFGESLSDNNQENKNPGLLTVTEEQFCSALAKAVADPETGLADATADSKINKNIIIRQLLEEYLPSIEFKMIYEDYFQNNPAVEKIAVTGNVEKDSVYKSLAEILIESKNAKKEKEMIEILSRELIQTNEAVQKFLNINNYIKTLSALLIKKDLPINKYINQKNKNKPLFNFIPSLIYKPDTGSLIAGGTDRFLKLFDRSLKETGISNSNGDESSHMAGITGLCWLNDEKTEFASSSEDGFIRIWSVKENKFLYQYRVFVSSDGINSIAWHNGNPEIIASATPSGILYLQKKKDKFEVNGNWEFSQNRAVVKAASLDSGLVAGYEDGSIELWQWPASEKVININQKQKISGRKKVNAELLSLSLSDDGRIMTAGYKDGTVEIWEMKSFKILKILPAYHNGGVTASVPGSICEINGNKGFFLASGGNDHKLKTAYYRLIENSGQLRWAEKENKDSALLIDQELKGGSLTAINTFYKDNKLEIYTAQTGSLIRAESYMLNMKDEKILLSSDKKFSVMTAEDPEKSVKIINGLLSEDRRTDEKIKKIIDGISLTINQRFNLSRQLNQSEVNDLSSVRFIKTLGSLKPLLDDILKLYYASDTSSEVEIFSQKDEDALSSFKIFAQIQPERDYLQIAAAGLRSPSFCMLDLSGDKWEVKRLCDIELKLLFYDQPGKESDSYVNYYKTCNFGLYLNDASVVMNNENKLQTDCEKSSLIIKLEKLNQTLHSFNLNENLFVKKAKVNFDPNEKSIKLICGFQDASLGGKYFSYSGETVIDKGTGINDINIWLENINKKSLPVILAGYRKLLSEKNGNPESFSFLLKEQAAGIEKISKVGLVSENPFIISLHCLLKNDVLLPAVIHVMPDNPGYLRILADEDLFDNLSAFQNDEALYYSLKKDAPKENFKKINSLKKTYGNKINPLIRETSEKCIDLYDYSDLFTSELLDNIESYSNKEMLFKSFFSRNESESRIKNVLYGKMNELIFSGEEMSSGKIKAGIENILKPLLEKEIISASEKEAARVIGMTLINDTFAEREKLLGAIENSYLKSMSLTGSFINSNRSLLSKSLLAGIFERQLERSFDEVQIMLSRQSYSSTIQRLWDEAWIILSGSSDEINRKLKTVLTKIILELPESTGNYTEREVIQLKALFDNVTAESDYLKRKKSFYKNDPLISSVMSICLDVQSDLLARSWTGYLKNIAQKYTLSLLALSEGSDDKIRTLTGTKNSASFYESFLSELLKIHSMPDSVLKKSYNQTNQWQLAGLNEVTISWPEEARDLYERICNVLNDRDSDKKETSLTGSLKKRIKRESEILAVSAVERIYGAQTGADRGKKKVSLNERLNKIAENIININKFYNDQVCPVIKNNRQKLNGLFNAALYKFEGNGLIKNYSLKFKFVDFNQGFFNLRMQLCPSFNEIKSLIPDFSENEDLKFVLNDGNKIHFNEFTDEYNLKIQHFNLIEKIYASVLKPLMDEELSIKNSFINELKQKISEKGEALSAPIYEETDRPFMLKFDDGKLIFTYKGTALFEKDIDENIMNNSDIQNAFLKSLESGPEKQVNNEFKKYYNKSSLNSLAESIKYIDKKELKLFGRIITVRRENKDGSFILTAQYNGDDKLPVFVIKEGINLFIKGSILQPVLNLSRIKTDPPFDVLVGGMTEKYAEPLAVKKVNTESGILQLMYEYKPGFLNLHHSGFINITDIESREPVEDINRNILKYIADKFSGNEIMPELKGVSVVSSKIDNSGRLEMLLKMTEKNNQIFLRANYSLENGFEIYRIENLQEALNGVFNSEITPYIKPSYASTDAKFKILPCKKFTLPVEYKFTVPALNVPVSIKINLETDDVKIDRWDFISLPGWYSASPQVFNNSNIYFNDEKRLIFITTDKMTMAPGIVWQDLIYANGTGEEIIKDNKLYLKGNVVLKGGMRVSHAVTGLNRYNLYFDSFVEEKKKINSLEMNGPLQIHFRKDLPYMIFRSSLDYMGIKSDDNMTHLDNNLSGVLQVHTDKPVPGTEMTLQMNPDNKDNQVKFNSVLKNMGDFSIIRLSAQSDRQKITCRLHGILTNLTSSFDNLPSVTTGNIIKIFLRQIKNSIERPLQGDIQLGNHKVTIVKNKKFLIRDLNAIKEEFAEEDIFIEEQKVKIFFGEWVPWEEPFDIVYIGKGTKFQMQREFAKIKMILKSGKELNKFLRKKIEFVYKPGLAESLFSTLMTPEQLFRNEVVYKKVGSLVLYYDKSMRMHVYKNNIHNSWEHVWSAVLEGTKDQRIFWEPLFYRESAIDFVIFHNKGSFFAIKNHAAVPATVNDGYNDENIRQIGQTYGMKKLLQSQRRIIAEDGLPEDLAATGAWMEGCLNFLEKPKIASTRLMGNDYLCLNYPDGSLTDYRTGRIRTRFENILVCGKTVFSSGQIKGDEFFLSMPGELEKTGERINAIYNDIPVKGHIEKINSNTALIFTNEPGRSGDNNRLFIIRNNKFLETSWLYSTGKSENAEDLYFNRIRLSSWFEENRGFITARWFTDLNKYLEVHNENSLPVQLIVGAPRSSVKIYNTPGISDQDISVRLGVIYGDENIKMQVIASDYPVTESVFWTKIQNQFFGLKSRLIPVSDHVLIWNPTEYMKIVVNKSWLERNWKANPAGEFLIEK